MVFLRTCDTELSERAGGERDLGGIPGASKGSHPTCPYCTYRLTGLTRPYCPECGKELMLAVGAVRPPLGWLLMTLAPGFFSGIAACLVGVLIVIHLVMIGSTWTIIALVDSFGWLSGASAVLLAIRRHRFLSLPIRTQRWIAIGVWLIHVAMLGFFIMLGQFL